MSHAWWDRRNWTGVTVETRKYIRVIFNDAKVLIELGPGTGVFTDRLLEFMSPDATLLIFELNDIFYSNLKNRITDKRVHIIHDSAEKLSDYLQQYELSKADVIVSSLPLANFPHTLRESILDISERSLSEKGKFVQFQYSLQSKQVIRSKFNNVRINFTPLNFPPAFIYTCQKNT
jgi:phospholipid N-methyltransferase